MPPRIRTRASKVLKENIDTTENKLKTIKNNTKAPRKALADKTNSASDDTSIEISKTSKKTISIKSLNAERKQNTVNQKAKTKRNIEQKQNIIPKQQNENAVPTNEVRPRRDRRLPSRFVENPLLNNLSQSRESLNLTCNSSTATTKDDKTAASSETLLKSNRPDPSPFKTPTKADSSLVTSRPKRICRLPSRFDDHSISPSKYIPIQPGNASTPIQQSKIKSVVLENQNNVNHKENVNNKEHKELKKQVGKKRLVRPTRPAIVDTLQKETSDNSSDKSSPDSNNNAKGRSTRVKKIITSQSQINKKQPPMNKNQSPIKKFLTPMNKFQLPVKKSISPINKVIPKQSTNNKRIIDKDISFKVLGGGKKSQENDKKDLDVYEFTFDPNEEPQPQKKKRKKTVTKKPSKPKPKKVIKSSYDQNISKALAALKNAIKPLKPTGAPRLTQITENIAEVEPNHVTNNVNKVQNTNHENNQENNMLLNDTDKNSVHECNYPSIRIEDIAADIEPSMDHNDDINYSPVNSPRPHSPMTSDAFVNPRGCPERPAVLNNDPLNLQEELSFFDEQPVASSSMNMSVRHPLASPWRVEFGSLPIKWPVNTYVKPNMTPAVESSFISSEDTNKKKHVYTNMIPETNDVFSETGNNTNFKQTSILSFIKEMAEKSAKKKRGRSVSPTKAFYEEIVDANAVANKNKKSVKKANNKVASTNNTSEEISSSGNDTSNEKANTKETRNTRKRKNDENICNIPSKSPRKQKDNNCTYFGFDDSENQEQENKSPIKINTNPKGRFLRPRSKAVLKEINGPIRAALPLAAKNKITSSEAVNRVYEELKAGADAPHFPEKKVDDNATNIEDIDPLVNEDSQSVHLFEDIEVVHHLKPSRKSYGKAKKVTFRQRSTSDSDTQDGIVAEQNNSSDYDDLADLTFEIPNVKEKKNVKKRKPKKLMSKKEEQEAEQWAANFNSMCEDIEEFPLLVE